MLIFKKKFWKEFASNFRESKWLIIKYLIVGIYLIVSGIIANRLSLNELTYFNAILTLSYIGEMISFGCSEGFGMFANLNIGDPDKYRKFVKVGFVFSTLVNFVFTVLLCAFPNFVIRSWLGLDFEVDMVFYYLMLISFFISAVGQYIADMLKKLGLFGWQMIKTIVGSGLTILGLLLLVVASSLVLRLIASVYIIASVIALIFSYLALLKNKTFPINIFSPEKIKIGKEEFKTILARASSEIIFEVGYIFLSLFILRSSTILYNQYCYYENVLDILNGVFFAYVNVVAIKICRSIGEKDRAKAYHHAMYAKWAVIVIWVGYAIISLALYYPIRLGLNTELQATSFIPLLLYLALSLVRWIAWSRCTYIIGQSERYAEHGLIWESCVSVYYVLLYFIAPLLPYSMYLVFGLIAIESIVKIIAYGKIIKEKKWLVRLEEHIEEEEEMLEYGGQDVADNDGKEREPSVVSEEVVSTLKIDEDKKPKTNSVSKKTTSKKRSTTKRKLKEHSTSRTRARFSR